MGKTSSAVKRRYNAKVYRQIAVSLKRELVDEWEQKLAQDGIAKAEFIRDAINAYLAQKGAG
jgi:metal-responsive CopG/Arc/MetJ family transcriptional regulator